LILHEDFHGWLSDGPKEQVTAALRHMKTMLCNGRPNSFKGCQGPNKGWLRAAVGGTNGRQFYLWFALHGAGVVDGLLEPGQILVRAVRHHDETSAPIDARGDVVAWTPHDLFEQADRAEVLSPAQRRAAMSDAPIQLVLGSPGAGKTTVLQEMLRHLEGRVLYLTFSANLAERAREAIPYLVDDKAEPIVMTFGELFEKLGAQPVPRELSFEDAAAILRRGLGPRVKELGPWIDDVPALLAEVQAHLVGRFAATPALDRMDAYVAARGDTIGVDAAQAAWRVTSWLSANDLDALFPGPRAAWRILERLAEDTWDPNDLRAVSWLVVDEVQDLTSVELDVVLALAPRAGLKLAGDEGQTLRATGFSWAGLKDKLHGRGPLTEARLDANVRSTREVAGFVQRVGRAYQRLAKASRPCAQGAVEIDPVAGGQVVLLEVDAIDDTLRDALGAADAVVTIGRRSALVGIRAPSLTSETSKGLDFDSVALLGLGAARIELSRLMELSLVDRAATERGRTLIDHVRVAASRAVSRIVVIEDAASVAGVRDLIGDGDERDPGLLRRIEVGELAAFFEVDTGDALTRLGRALELCAELLESSPSQALAQADSAQRLFVQAGRARAVGDGLRSDLYRSRARARLVSGLEADDRVLLKGSQSDFRQAGDLRTSERVALYLDALEGRVTKLVERLSKGPLDVQLDVRVGDRLMRALDPVVRAEVARVARSAELDPTTATAVLEIVERLGWDDPEVRDACALVQRRGTLATLRQGGDLREAETFAAQHGLVDEGLSAVTELARAIERFAQAEHAVTDAEWAALAALLPDKLIATVHRAKRPPSKKK